MLLRKSPGALERPKGWLAHSYDPHGVMKVVRCPEHSATNPWSHDLPWSRMVILWVYQSDLDYKGADVFQRGFPCSTTCNSCKYRVSHLVLNAYHTSCTIRLWFNNPLYHLYLLKKQLTPHKAFCPPKRIVLGQDESNQLVATTFFCTSWPGSGHLKTP